MVRLKDVYNLNEKRLCTANELLEKYGIGHFLSWQSLLRSIPKEFKQILARDKPRTDEPLESIRRLQELNKTAKWAYNILLKQSEITIPTKCQLKWKNELNLDETYNWEKTYELLYSSTDDFKIRWLQYRIWHRIIPTNARLETYGIRETGDCDRCPGVRESLQHVFLHCPVVDKFWRDFCKMFGNVKVTGIHVLLGGTIRDSLLPMQVMYVLILLGKLYIRNCKYMNLPPSLKGFKTCVLNYISVERVIAGMTGDNVKFLKKWEKLLELLKNSERPP